MPYPKCSHIERSKPKYEVNEELAKEIASNAEILPLFEKGLFEHSFIKNYSLKTNELLKCRWNEYVQNIESRVFAPFQFPDIRDLHFHNYAVRYLREATVRYQNHRKSLKPGPGVDYGGQMPIPQELMMKRTTPIKEAEKKSTRDNKNGGDAEGKEIGK